MSPRKPQGILMSAPMVLALLREARCPGTGKTQTRRIAKIAPRGEVYSSGNGESVIDMLTGEEIWPRYRTGDQLWVKETHAYVGTCDPGLLIWRADYPACVPGQYENVPTDPREIKWSASLLMPRRAARLTMRCSEVRLERLQDISEGDAIQEGIIERTMVIDIKCYGGPPIEETARRYFVPGDDYPYEDAVSAYRALWQNINRQSVWDQNPWVWVYEFADVTEGKP